MFTGTDICLSRKNSHYRSSYINNFTFPQNFDKTYNPLMFISTLCNSRKLFLLDAVLSCNITKYGVTGSVRVRVRYTVRVSFLELGLRLGLVLILNCLYYNSYIFIRQMAIPVADRRSGCINFYILMLRSQI